jgi:cereblon
VLQDQENAPALGAARADEDDPIRCRTCGEALAPRSARIDLSPSTFVNPEGVVFDLLGVRVAPGSTAIGAPTRYWTWFPGCAWQAAICRACGAHVGWAYTGASTFWGLVRDRVE